MNNNVVRKRTFALLKENWVILLVAVFLTSLPSIVCSLLYSELNADVLQSMNNVLENPDADPFAIIDLASEFRFTWLSPLGSLLSYAFSIALASGFLALTRKGTVEINDFTSKLKYGFSSILIGILMMLAVVAGCLLFIVPGIMLAFGYSQAYRIKSEHPDYDAVECLKRSRFAMRGKKMELFDLILSFLLYILLILVIDVVVDAIVTIILSGVAYDIVSTVLSTAITSFITILTSIAGSIFYDEVVFPHSPEPDIGGENTATDDVFEF